MMIRALSIFAVTCALMNTQRSAFLRLDRPTAALAGAVLMIAAGVLTPDEAYGAIDWNTIVLLLGMFLLAGCLRLSGFFEWAAAVVPGRAHTPRQLHLTIMFFAGLLSAVVVNDTVWVIVRDRAGRAERPGDRQPSEHGDCPRRAAVVRSLASSGDERRNTNGNGHASAPAAERDMRANAVWATARQWGREKTPSRVRSLLQWLLRRQIRVLGAMVLLVALLSVMLGVLLVRQSQASRVADAGRHLFHAADRLSERQTYLARSVGEQRDPAARPIDDDALLRAITSAVLSESLGVEGGFYIAASRRLVGYSYPTYQGSGPKTDLPPAERPTIERVAGAAVEQGRAIEERLDAGPDLLIFRARPLGETVGAAWVMQRLVGVRRPQQHLYASFIALITVSGGTVLIAWAFARRLDRGVATIEAGAHAMEGRLEALVPTTGTPELDRIGSAINRLAHAVKAQEEQRLDLERRLQRTERLAALGRLVGGVAHEVRNPLASIKLKLHLVRRADDDRERRASAFDVIEEEVARLDRLVERLLTLAKPASSGTPTDLEILLEKRLDFWWSRAAERNVTLEWRPDARALSAAVADGDRVRRIIDNLIANALDALEGHDGRVAVELRRPTPTQVSLTVSDTGPGVPPDMVGRLFEPFFTTRKDGTGLGLFLSAEMARALGGDLLYEPAATGGARFEVLLPC